MNVAFYYQLVAQLLIGLVYFCVKLFIFIQNDHVYRQEQVTDSDPERLVMIDFKKSLLSWQLVVALLVSIGVIGVTQFMN